MFFWQRLPGFSAHNNSFVERCSFEVVEVRGLAPRQVPVLPNCTFFIACKNHRQHTEASNGDGCFDVRVMFVALNFDVLVGETVDVGDVRIQDQLG